MDNVTKNRKIRVFIILIVFILAFANFSGFKELTGINNDYYRYSNYSGTVTRHEIFYQGRFMSKEYPEEFWKTKEFERKYPKNTDTTLFRNFSINPLKFWRWGEYIFNWRYNLPYINWKEVRKRRGYNLKYSDNFQEF